MLTLFNDTDLFSSGELSIREYDIPDGRCTLYEHFFNREESNVFYTALLAETAWQQEPITIHGQTHLTPRLTAWYGKRTSGPDVPFTPDLLRIKNRVEAGTGVAFNCVLLNLYRSGKDSVAWHRDHEKEYGVNPAIGSVSFGETRPFQIRHKFRKELAKIEIPLEHGSLLLMSGTMQHFWEHQVPKTAKDIKPRINLTFRTVQ